MYVLMQTKGCICRKAKEPNRVTVTVEVKVLIIAFSYIFIALVATTSFAISSAKLERVREEVYAYFQCESCGINSESGVLSTCSRSGFEQLTNSTLATFAYSLFGVYSLVTMVYVIRVSDLKTCCGMIWRRFRSLKSYSTTMSQMASEGEHECYFCNASSITHMFLLSPSLSHTLSLLHIPYYTHMHTHAHALTHTHTCTHTYTHMHTNTHAHKHTSDNQ